MSKIKIHRLAALPATLEASSIYIIKGDDAVEAKVYFTGNDGTEVRHLLTKNEVTQMISNAVADLSPTLQVVGTITERDALVLTRDTIVLVLDASQDPTVTAGSATYVYSVSSDSFAKTSETESMDITVTWASVVGRPESTPDTIDAAVANSHRHSNLPVLEKLAEDADGNLLYNGNGIRAALDESQW